MSGRRIVSLAADSRFALCEDGTVWFWTGQKWEPWNRPPIPEPEIPVETLLPSPTFSQAERDAEYERRQTWPTPSEVITPPAKRGPGRPRKVTP